MGHGTRVIDQLGARSAPLTELTNFTVERGDILRNGLWILRRSGSGALARFLRLWFARWELLGGSEAGHRQAGGVLCDEFRLLGVRRNNVPQPTFLQVEVQGLGAVIQYCIKEKYS